MTDVRWVGAMLVGTSLLGACAGSGEGLDENGRPLGEAAAGGELQPTIESIQQHVFDRHCVNCHRGSHISGLELEDAQRSYEELVDVPSTEVPTIDRVEPGDPDNSYLIDKLEGTGAPERMPRGQPPLSQETIDVIREWIANGAPPPGTAMAAQSVFLPATDE